MARLTADLKRRDALTGEEIARMWALFEAHYDAVSEMQFRADLEEKDAALLERDPSGAIQGFSTYRLIEGSPRCLFSGDTIIHPDWWGRNDFARSWLENAGRIAAAGPEPLYWLLIVKGHRTYRYLPLFAKEFVPRAEAATPALVELRDRLARGRFGDWYDAEAGVVRFPEPRGQLRAALAAVPEKDRARRDVAFFLGANPGYVRGDELVCLTRLAPDNLTPIARRAFEAGQASPG
ncbi:MAG: hypothetical protein JNJ73_17010 [Hyphomonadaceae bacterium]|nr:hypothetical protein [Hyphomonadaceae bacterium]